MLRHNASHTQGPGWRRPQDLHEPHERSMAATRRLRCLPCLLRRPTLSPPYVRRRQPAHPEHSLVAQPIRPTATPFWTPLLSPRRCRRCPLNTGVKLRGERTLRSVDDDSATAVAADYQASLQHHPSLVSLNALLGGTRSQPRALQCCDTTPRTRKDRAGAARRTSRTSRALHGRDAPPPLPSLPIAAPHTLPAIRPPAPARAP